MIFQVKIRTRKRYTLLGGWGLCSKDWKVLVTQDRNKFSLAQPTLSLYLIFSIHNVDEYVGTAGMELINVCVIHFVRTSADLSVFKTPVLHTLPESLTALILSRRKECLRPCFQQWKACGIKPLALFFVLASIPILPESYTI